jgi:hypothetical protein
MNLTFSEQKSLFFEEALKIVLTELITRPILHILHAFQ